jgi:integrase
MSLTHDLIGGKLHLFQRPRSRFWQCATFLDGKFRRYSTREESLDRAKALAEDWYLSLQLKHRAGELKGGKLFKDAADQFLREYEALTMGERNPDYVKQQGDRLRNHLLPFFGEKVVTDITLGLVQEYRIHRMTSRKNVVTGAVMRPARSTLHHEIVTLRHVLKTANRHGWLPSIPDLSAPYKTSGKIAHRAWFSPEEYKRLRDATRARAADPPKASWKWECEQFHDFVLFMVNTGLRPDEAARLEFRDVEIVADKGSGETILEISVRGKRGVGYCKSMPGAVLPFERLRGRQRATQVVAHASKGIKRAATIGGAAAALDGNRNVGVASHLRLPAPTDRLFPNATFRHLLNNVLDELNLKQDREGRMRTSYSLRHTYICMRLMEGADIYQIAKNCRTSVEMIEKFYAAHIKNVIDAAAVNVRRESSNERPKNGAANAKPPKPRKTAGKYGQPKHFG